MLSRSNSSPPERGRAGSLAPDFSSTFPTRKNPPLAGTLTFYATKLVRNVLLYCDRQVTSRSEWPLAVGRSGGAQPAASNSLLAACRGEQRSSKRHRAPSNIRPRAERNRNSAVRGRHSPAVSAVGRAEQTDHKTRGRQFTARSYRAIDMVWTYMFAQHACLRVCLRRERVRERERWASAHAS